MISRFIKRIVQNAILSTEEGARQSEMNSAHAEDLSFAGLPADTGTPEERAARILEKLTLDEKISFVAGYKSLGIRALPNHGLPSVWMTDATSGPRCYGPTAAFPSAVAMAASWDPRLIAEAASHVSEAARARGVSILLGPGVNIARIPTNGRNFEYMGEDPFLAGTLAAAYIRSCRENGIICTVKHLAANNSDYDRHKISSDIDERTLREIYLPAFEMAVKDGGCQGVMSAYNPVNGTWASENSHLLTDILRKEWGFKGFVVSDWNSLYSTAGPMNAGLDLEMPAPKWLSHEKVKAAIQSGAASESNLSRMVRNLLTPLFEAGVYDRPVTDPEAQAVSSSHDQAALKAARSGLVLLKNTPAEKTEENSENAPAAPVLPLQTGEGITIAVCGPWALKTPTLGGGSCYVSQRTTESNLADALKMFAADGTKIVTAATGPKGIQKKEESIIRNADAVILTCGFNHMMESECYDRPWHLPKNQRKMLRKAAELNPRCIAVITAGGGVETASWISQIPAVIHGLYLGQWVGQATAEVLLGRISPSGKLPFTMANQWEDIAAGEHYPKRPWTTTPGRVFWGQGNPKLRRMRHWKYSEGLNVGYRHFDSAGIAPAFCFGHGLTYTRMSIKTLELSKTVLGPEESLDVRVVLKNEGEQAAAEVVQIYVEDPESSLPRPPKELKGFRKVFLQPGESAEVKIDLPPRSFRFWNPGAGEHGDWTVETGDFIIHAGFSSRDIRKVETVVLRDR